MKRISESSSSFSSSLEEQKKNTKKSSLPQSQSFNSQQKAMSPSNEEMSSYYSQQNHYAQMAMLQYQNAYYNQQNHYMNQQQHQQNSFLYNQAGFATNPSHQYMRLPPPTMQSPSTKQQQNQIIFDTSQPPPPCSNNKKIDRTSTQSTRFAHQSGFDTRHKYSQNLRLRKNVMPPRNLNVTNPTNYRLVRSQTNGPENGHNLTEENHITINKKSKRKPMSTRYTKTKEWNRDDALKALEMEKECSSSRTPMLILKFPDPELNKHIVRNYSPFIETVHFQQPSTARYCFVQLKPNADIDKVKSDLCKISFGTGHVLAERKFQSGDEGQPVSPEEIDPYTLYIGNLPTHISVKAVRDHFPKATRIDIGYAQRMKYTRYAFIRYNSVEDSMEAYKTTFNSGISSRSLIVRFRRSKGNIGLPGESRKPNQKREIAATQSHRDTATSNRISIAETNYSDSQVSTSQLQPSKDPSGIKTKNKIQKDNSYKSSDFIKDSKDYVPDDANHIPISTIKEEQEDPYSVEEEINLLGTRIKDEPPDDDELLANAQNCTNIEDEYDYDSDPDYNNHNNSSKKTCLSHGNSTSKSLNWEQARQNELNKEENKPEIDSRGNIVSGSFSRIFNTNNSIFSFERKHDDLDDLFESMNREDDDDY